MSNTEYAYTTGTPGTAQSVVNYTSGSMILMQKTGSNTIRFLYDNVGRIEGMLHNGTAYYYMYNIQGDVIAIAPSFFRLPRLFSTMGG